MSAIEQEPQSVSGVPLTTVLAVLAAVQVPGVSQDKSLSALSAPTAGVTSCPYKVVRVRGIAWLTTGAQFLQMQLRQGVGTGGAIVQGQTFSTAVAVTQVPVAFELIDFAPIGLNYSLVASVSASTGIASCTFSVTGFNG